MRRCHALGLLAVLGGCFQPPQGDDRDEDASGSTSAIASTGSNDPSSTSTGDGSTSTGDGSTSTGESAAPGDDVWDAYHDHLDDDQAGGVAVGSDGVYVCGQEDVNAAGQGRNAVVTKYDFDGDVLWAVEPLVAVQDYCTGIVVGPDDNPVLCGSTSDGGAWTAAVLGLDGSSGAQRWSEVDMAIDARFYGIGLAPNGDAVLAGGMFVKGQTDAVAQRYDTDGNLLWTSVQDIEVSDVVWGVAVSSEDDVYVSGLVDDNAGTQRGSLFRLDGATGNLVWVDTVDGSESIDELADVTIDPTDDRAIVLGRDRDGDNLMVRKYDRDGDVDWSHTLSAAVHSGSYYGEGGIEADTDGTIYFAASALGATADIWVRAFDGTNGHESWSMAFDPRGSDAYGREIAVSTDSLYVVGEVHTGTSFDIAAFRLVK